MDIEQIKKYNFDYKMVLKALDVNKDNKIEFDEFMAYMS